MIKGIIDELIAQKSQAILLVATNPVDVLTHVALKYSGWPKSRVIGSGTVLDSSRFRYLLSQHCNVDVSNVHAYILGEHGDSEFAAWSMTHVAGVSVDEYCAKYGPVANWSHLREAIVQDVKDSAYHIINYKEATYYAIGMALTRIVGTILQDQNSILTVSTFLDGEYGIKDICLSVPCLVGQDGVKQIVEAKITPGEKESLLKSASILQNALQQLGDL